MKPKFPFLLFFWMAYIAAGAQPNTSAKFNIGDAAPQLRVKEWIKGTPIPNFERRKVYVVEFWATWCRPCIASMPHLSRSARKYRHKATFLAIDVYETQAYKPASITQLKAFVDGMGHRMNFPVAAEDTSHTVHDWLNAYGVESIPTSFVIDGQGRVAWIGHPSQLDTVLRKILNNTWDIKAALAKRVSDFHLEQRDYGVPDKVRRYQDRYDRLLTPGNPDSVLFAINEMVKKDPGLKYAPQAAAYSFAALLISNPHKAYEYGEEVKRASTSENPAWDMIIGDIKEELGNINIPAEIYHLGAECYQAEIDEAPYPQLEDRAKLYWQMAEWYRRAGDKPKAIKALKKALKFYRKGK